MLIFLDQKNSVKVGIMMSLIKFNTVWQYSSNPNMDISATQYILMFMSWCVPLSCFLAQCMRLHFPLIKYSMCKSYAGIIFELRLFETEQYFFREVVHLVAFYLQRNFLSLSLYALPYTYNIVLNHQYVLQWSWLFNVCSRGNFLASHSSSEICFYYYL